MKTIFKYIPFSRIFLHVSRLRSSSVQVVYSNSVAYKLISTLNSQIAIVNDNMIRPTNLPFISTSSPSAKKPSSSKNTRISRRVANNFYEIKYDDSTVVKHPRAQSFSFRDGGYIKQDDILSAQPSEDFNTFVYEMDGEGQLGRVVSFTQKYANIVSVGV